MSGIRLSERKIEMFSDLDSLSCMLYQLLNYISHLNMMTIYVITVKYDWNGNEPYPLQSSFISHHGTQSSSVKPNSWNSEISLQPCRGLSVKKGIQLGQLQGILIRQHFQRLSIIACKHYTNVVGLAWCKIHNKLWFDSLTLV